MQFQIPNLFRYSTLFLILLVTQLFSIVATLLMYKGNFLLQLGLVSLYCYWCVLLSVVILSWCRGWLNRRSQSFIIVFVVLACLLPYCLIELIAQRVFDSLYASRGVDVERFVAHTAIASIITLFVLRAFAIFSASQRRNKAEMQLKLQVLQSKIKPHFLFNSLNTIAELTTMEPKKAEQAVEALSALFRVSLQDDDKLHSLQQELDLCEKYLELERWRLQSRLHIKWSIAIEDKDCISVPKLILQPLLENAIVHGVLEDGHIDIKVLFKESRSKFLCVIINKKMEQQESLKFATNGIALDNIKLRLQVLYDDNFQFKVANDATTFTVTMKLPKSVMRYE